LAIDDYSPPDDPRQAADMAAKADALFRGAANRAARSRANRDGSLRAPHPPRALVVANGTQLPRLPDIQARCTIVRVERHAINREALTRAQQDGAQGLFAQAMFGYIQWLARDYAARVARYNQRALQLREMFTEPDAHPRIALALAGKLAALEL